MPPQSSSDILAVPVNELAIFLLTVITSIQVAPWNPRLQDTAALATVLQVAHQQVEKAGMSEDQYTKNATAYVERLQLVWLVTKNDVLVPSLHFLSVDP